MSSNGKRSSRLGSVKPSTIAAGVRFCFYGVESIGKSTLAAHAPKPIFIDCEDGTGRLVTSRYPFRDEPGGHVPRSYAEVLDAVEDLLASDHDFETVVFDTVDRLESLIWAHCMERDSGKNSVLNKGGKKLTSIESYGFGKGYTVALDEFRRLCRLLDDLRLRRGMNILMLGHTNVRLYKNPEGDDYDRYQLSLHDKAAGFIKEWVDVVGFCSFEEGGAKLDDNDTRAKGYSTGRRLIRFERTATYDAKSRIPLPQLIELPTVNPWTPIGAAIRAGLEMDPAKLSSLIADELVRIADPELDSQVETAIENADGNVATLSRYLNNLKRREPKEEAPNV